MLHNIFQTIAIDRAFAFCDSIEDCFCPQDLVIDYLVGYGRYAEPTIAKYWLLGQKLAIMSILKLSEWCLTRTDVSMDFWHDRLIFPDDDPDRDPEFEFDDLFISSESEPEIGQGLSGLADTYIDLFQMIGFTVIGQSFYIPERPKPDYFLKCLQDVNYIHAPIVRPDDTDDFLEWLKQEDIDVFPDNSYWIYRFETADSYQKEDLEMIFNGCIRLCNVFISKRTNSGARVYVFVPVNMCSYCDCDDRVDLSSLDPRTFLLALSCYGKRRPGLPLFDDDFRTERSVKCDHY